MPAGLLDGDLLAAVYKLLTTNVTVLQWVPADRISPVQLPEGCAYPAISFFRVDGPSEFTLDGPARLARPRIQVDTWANTARDADLVARAALLALEGYRGTVSGVDQVFDPWNCVINGIIQEDFRGPVWEAPTHTYHASVDLVIWLND